MLRRLRGPHRPRLRRLDQPRRSPAVAAGESKRRPRARARGEDEQPPICRLDPDRERLRALVDAKREATLWEEAYERASESLKVSRNYNASLVDTNANLRAQLAEAQRNDTRDPKTGRFVKAER